jgi:hypothetical protein
MTLMMDTLEVNSGSSMPDEREMVLGLTMSTLAVAVLVGYGILHGALLLIVLILVAFSVSCLMDDL